MYVVSLSVVIWHAMKIFQEGTTGPGAAGKRSPKGCEYEYPNVNDQRESDAV